MTLEREVNELFTTILESITFAIESFEVEGYQMGRGVFIIDYVGKHPVCNLKDIYENTRFPASTASRRVDELVKHGFIVRNRSSEDRREIILELSEKGKVVYKVFRDHRMKSLRKFLKLFTKKEIESFVKILSHLVDHKDEIFIV
jgi:DNA-binding MarR family transcriptional regulator